MNSSLHLNMSIYKNVQIMTKTFKGVMGTLDGFWTLVRL